MAEGFEIIIARSIEKLVSLLEGSTELTERQKVALAGLRIHAEWKDYIDSILDLSKHIKRKREKAIVNTIDKLCLMLQINQKDKDDSKLSNMLKRLG